MSNEPSRFQNITKNIKTGMFNQLTVLLFTFITRTAFIHTLGVEYLGISGLFSNILKILSMAELGFGYAIIYSMYKPIAEKDEKKLAALINYYAKIYHTIAIVIAVVGILLIPFLKYIVNMSTPVDNLELYYVMYLANTVMSYLFVYKTSITIANQKSSMLNVYKTIFTIIQNILQLIFLFVYPNFFVYLGIQLISTFFLNFFTAWHSQRLYPFINDPVKLDAESKKEIAVNVRAMAIYKIGDVLLNATDSILISIMVGTLWVGYYSNYNIVLVGIITVVMSTFNSAVASVGNLSISAPKEHQYTVLNSLNLAAWWIAAFCSVCFLVLFQDFITLWIGKDFLLSIPTVVCIVLNFYIFNTQRSICLFRDTTGMFRETQYVFIFTCVLNLVLSVIFGRMFGITGIFAATVVARLATNFWFDPCVVIRTYFGRKVFPYFKTQLIYFLCFAVALSLTWVATICLPMENPILLFACKAVLCVLIPNLFFLLLFFRTKEFGYIKGKVLRRKDI